MPHKYLETTWTSLPLWKERMVCGHLIEEVTYSALTATTTSASVRSTLDFTAKSLQTHGSTPILTGN